MTPLDILPLEHQIDRTPVADPASLLGTRQMTARAARNRVREIPSAEHGSRSIGYAGDLCDSHFVRLRRFAGAALPDSVRLRRAPATHSTDQTAWFVQRSSDYRRAFQGLRECRVCTEFLDLASLNAMLESLCSGNGTAAQAATVHRALDAGLFAAALEWGLVFGPSPTPPLFESVADMRRICTAR